MEASKVSKAVKPISGATDDLLRQQAGLKMRLLKSIDPEDAGYQQLSFTKRGDYGKSLLRTETPIDLTATHSDAIVIGNTEFNITINRTEGLAALSQNGQLLKSAYAENGNIQIDVSDLELIPGEYDLVITSFNTYPYESTVNVIAPDGAYLIYDSFDLY